ncbi:MAG: PorP/SprF family type IX secretion system membrane protein, partial [Cyclobacteriaceae bacterium]
MRVLLSQFFICVFVLLSICKSAAQENDYTQYYANLPTVNSGFTGLDDYFNLNTGVREGWNNFGVVNNNLYLSAFGALNSSKRSGRKNNSLRLSSPKIFEEMQSDKKFRRRHGVGGMVTSRTVGPYKSFGASANYAYHLPISGKLNISLGSRLGYTNQRIDFTGLTVRDEINDLFYQSLIQSGQGSQNTFLVDFGAVLYSNRFYLGLSSSNLIIEKLNGDQLFNLNEGTQYRLQSGTVFSLNPELDLSPGFTATYQESYDLLWAANLRLRYKNLVSLGAAYNSDAKISMLVGLATTNLSINYAYDIYTSDLSDFDVHTHELVLGITCLL